MIGSNKNLYKLVDSTVVKVVMSIALLMKVWNIITNLSME